MFRSGIVNSAFASIAVLGVVEASRYRGPFASDGRRHLHQTDLAVASFFPWA